MRRLIFFPVILLVSVAFLAAEQKGGDNGLSIDVVRSVSDSLQAPSPSVSCTIEYDRRFYDRFSLCGSLASVFSTDFDVNLSLGLRIFLIVGDYYSDFSPMRNASVWMRLYPVYGLPLRSVVAGVVGLGYRGDIGVSYILPGDFFIDASAGLGSRMSEKSVSPILGLSIGKRFGYSDHAEVRQ